MTVEVIEALVAKVAVVCNGGGWDTHYTAAQKALWVGRVSVMFGGQK